MRPLISKALLAAALVLLHVCPALASTIRGSITDAETGEPLGYANVIIDGWTNTGVDITRGAMGGEDGTYELPNIPGGRYRFRILYVGYTTYSDSLLIRDNRTYVVDAAMSVQPFAVDEIVVEADRIQREEDVQTGLMTFDIQTLDQVPAIGEPDPIRTLQLLPGVQAASDISSGLYVRGGGPDQTLILLDQVPVYNPTHAFGFFSTFNSGVIDDVTLYKGAYPANYAGRLGAVLDLTTREGNREKVRGIVGVSTISARATLDGPLNFWNGTWLASGRRTYLEPILGLLRRNDDQIPYYNFWDLNGKLRFGGDRHWLVLSGYGGRDNLRIEIDADSEIELGWGNTILMATYNHLFNDEVLGKLQVSASEYVNNADVRILTTPAAFNNRLRDYTFRGDLTWQPSPIHRIATGFQASMFDFLYKETFNEIEQLGFDVEPYELSLYAEDQWRPAYGTAVRAGLRARYLSDGERFFLEPRLSMSQAVGDKVRLKAGGGVYNQYLQLISTEGLSATDFYLPIDETATPGSSWQAVLGMDWDISPAYSMTIETYYTGLDNLVQLNNTTSANQQSFAAADVFYTGGTGFATGFEIFAQRRIGPLTGWLGYTLGWTRRTFVELNDGERFPPKYDRRHDISAVGNYRRGKWSFGAALIYATGQAFTPAAARYAVRDPATQAFDGDAQVLPAARNSARLLPYHRLDVNVRRDFSFFGKPAQWDIQIFNLYSRRNEWFVQYETDGPTTEATVVKQLPIIPSLGVTVEF